MKKKFKSILAVVVIAASAAYGYVSYTQYQNSHLAYANPLMEENVNALADVNGISTFKWKNDHIPNVVGWSVTGNPIYGDLFKGECSGRLCLSEKDIKDAKKDGYTANSCHSHPFIKCDVNLANL